MRAGALAAGGLALGATGFGTGLLPVPHRVSVLFEDHGPDGAVPDAPAGRVRLEQLRSAAQGRRIGLWTAVPHGHGDGAGLPVCLVVHGASSTTADFTDIGLARFLTAAVQTGVPPFVLAGPDGGEDRWEGPSGDTLLAEMPRWCRARGFDASRLAAYAWSNGAYGILRLMERAPRFLHAASLLSPAVTAGDAVFGNLDRLDGDRLALWCGGSDRFYPAVRELAAQMDPPPAIARWALGDHTRGYWNRVTPAAFAFAGRALAS